MEIRFTHWMGAIFVSLLLHLGMAYAIYRPGNGAAIASEGGVTVELGSAAALTAPLATLPVAAAEPDRTLEAPVDAEEATDIPAADSIVSETEARSSHSKIQINAIRDIGNTDTETRAVGAESTISVGMPSTLVAVHSIPAPKPVEPSDARNAPPPEPAAVQARSEVVVANEATPTPTNLSISSQAGNSDSRASDMANNDQTGRTSRNADIAQSYYSELSAWLSRHKQYPRRARRKRQEGVVEVEFVIDRNGQLLDYRVVTSSGFQLLDDEAQSLLKRAAPLPPIPGELEQSQLSIIAPISFSLR